MLGALVPAVDDAPKIIEQIIHLAIVFDVVNFLFGRIRKLSCFFFGFVEETHTHCSSARTRCYVRQT